MGRKKKAVPASAPGADAPPPAAPPVPQAAPAAALAPPSDNGHSKETPEFLSGILNNAGAWAEECGLKKPFDLSGPDRVNYPRHGHGYVVTVKEQSGKQRAASARYTSEGVRGYWSVDTLITG